MAFSVNLHLYFLFCYIYILGVFTKNPYSKPSECNVVYITTTTNIEPGDVEDIKINHGTLQLDWTSAISCR